MLPDLFSIGPVTAHTYGLFAAIGFGVGLFVAVHTAKTLPLPSERVINMGLFLILWSLVGARLMYVLIHVPHYRQHPLDVLKVWEGGLVFSGGLIAAGLALGYYLSRHRLSFWKMADLLAPAVAVGQGIGRIGCFMAGCCYGKPTHTWWGVVFTDPHCLAPLNVRLHPTQLYAAFSGLLIFVILMRMTPRKNYDGQVCLWFLILQSTARLILERFRGDPLGVIPGTAMSPTQLLSLLLLFAAVVTLVFWNPQKKNDLKEGKNA
jgi:phosphatidylglycerol:prolipoprotein diacylglycerol transferase